MDVRTSARGSQEPGPLGGASVLLRNRMRFLPASGPSNRGHARLAIRQGGTTCRLVRSLAPPTVSANRLRRSEGAALVVCGDGFRPLMGADGLLPSAGRPQSWLKSLDRTADVADVQAVTMMTGRSVGLGCVDDTLFMTPSPPSDEGPLAWPKPLHRTKARPSPPAAGREGDQKGRMP